MKTQHYWQVTRSTAKSSAWLAVHKTSVDSQIEAFAFTTLASARHHIGAIRNKRIRLNKLDDRNYDYNYAE
jgi:hypothetical protein